MRSWSLVAIDQVLVELAQSYDLRRIIVRQSYLIRQVAALHQDVLRALCAQQPGAGPFDSALMEQHL